MIFKNNLERRDVDDWQLKLQDLKSFPRFLYYQIKQGKKKHNIINI